VAFCQAETLQAGGGQPNNLNGEVELFIERVDIGGSRLIRQGLDTTEAQKVLAPVFEF
jgi:hypothetical protein